MTMYVWHIQSGRGNIDLIYIGLWIFFFHLPLKYMKIRRRASSPNTLPQIRENWERSVLTLGSLYLLIYAGYGVKLSK